MESSIQTLRVAPTVHTMMVERVSTETVITMKTMAVKASASAEVVWRVTSSEAVVQAACTVLEGQGNCCSTRSVRLENWLVRGRSNSWPLFRVEIPCPSTSITHSRIPPTWIM